MAGLTTCRISPSSPAATKSLRAYFSGAARPQKNAVVLRLPEVAVEGCVIERDAKKARFKLVEFCSYRKCGDPKLGPLFSRSGWGMQNCHGKQPVAGRRALDFDFGIINQSKAVQTYLFTVLYPVRDTTSDPGNKATCSFSQRTPLKLP